MIMMKGNRFAENIIFCYSTDHKETKTDGTLFIVVCRLDSTSYD